METTFIKSDWTSEVKKNELEAIINNASKILNDEGQNKIEPKSVRIGFVDSDTICVEYVGTYNNTNYSQSADFYRKENMQFILL